MQIIVIYILLIILFAIFKKVNAYDAFLEGVDESFKTVKNIFPNILAIIFAINVFINSGIMEILEKVAYLKGLAEGLGLEMLPATLEEAVAIAEESDFLHKVLPEELSRRYFAEERARCEALRAAADPAEYERIHYFNAI